MKVKVTVSIDDDVWERVQEYAKVQRTNASALVNKTMAEKMGMLIEEDHAPAKAVTPDAPRSPRSVTAPVTTVTHGPRPEVAHIPLRSDLHKEQS